MRGTNKSWFAKGMRAAIPIALGYLAVSFTLGIAAKNAGICRIYAVCRRWRLSGGRDSDIDYKCPLSSDVLCIKSETSTRHTDDPASASKL